MNFSERQDERDGYRADMPPWARTEAQRAANRDYWARHNERVAAEAAKRARHPFWHGERALVARAWFGRFRITVRIERSETAGHGRVVR